MDLRLMIYRTTMSYYNTQAPIYNIIIVYFYFFFISSYRPPRAPPPKRIRRVPRPWRRRWPRLALRSVISTVSSRRRTTARRTAARKTATTPPAAATAAKADHVTDRRSGRSVAAHGVPERHRPSAAVHAHGGRVCACTQEGSCLCLFQRLRRITRIRISRRARRLRIRPAAAVAPRTRQCLLSLGLNGLFWRGSYIS